MDENAPYAYFEDVNWGLLRLWGKRSGLRVLDVGCGFATTAEFLQKLGNEVTGVESSPEACEVARTRIQRVIQSELQAADLAEEQFDVLIFADVLEHLAWPLRELQRYMRWLAPCGSVIISLPNVGLWSVRFAHLAGRWEYQETGVLDRTHLRFFTRRSARWLMSQAGLDETRVLYNPGLVRPLVPLAKKMLAGDRGSSAPDALLKSRPYQLYLRLVYPVERVVASLWPGMLAFQMVFEAERRR
jgi:SAM-dependent methyltransferase